jgi:hypothetical protein
VVAAYHIWCFGFQVVGVVWSWGLCVRFVVRKPDIYPSAPHHTDNLKTKAPNTTGSSHLCNTLELLMICVVVPETCGASNKICNKNQLLRLVGIWFLHTVFVNFIIFSFSFLFTFLKWILFTGRKTEERPKGRYSYMS